MKILSPKEITRRLKELPEWTLERDGIQKNYEFKDFAHALLFINAVGYIAEQIDHHPDVIVNYRKVTLRLLTHYVGGITEKDFETAKRIEALLT